MSAIPRFPDIHINGSNLVLALWFSISQVYSSSFSRYHQFIVLPTELWVPITLKVFCNSEIVSEIFKLVVLVVAR